MAFGIPARLGLAVWRAAWDGEADMMVNLGETLGSLKEEDAAHAAGPGDTAVAGLEVAPAGHVVEVGY